MGKELAPFNIRTLTAQLGGFDTNFVSAVTSTKTPYPDDYAGSVTEAIATGLLNSTFKIDGDHIKAARVLYEMVVGEGFGKGKEGERVIVLGRDMWKSVEEVDGNWKHMMGTFGEVCNNVYLEE